MKIQGKIVNLKGIEHGGINDRAEAIIELSPQELREQLTAKELQGLLQSQYLSEGKIHNFLDNWNNKKYEETKSYPIEPSDIPELASVLANKIPAKEDKKPQDIEIFVSADMQGKLTTPIYIGITEITHLGLYEFYGKRWWITETGRLKSPQANKEPIGELELDPHREYPEWQRVMVKKINQTIRELNALSEIVRQR